MVEVTQEKITSSSSASSMAAQSARNSSGNHGKRMPVAPSVDGCTQGCVTTSDKSCLGISSSSSCDGDGNLVMGHDNQELVTTETAGKSVSVSNEEGYEEDLNDNFK